MLVRDGVKKGETSPLTQQRLKEVLDYNPQTGVFHRLDKFGWQTKEAGTLDPSNGYVKIMIDRQLYRAHRLAFLYMEGAFPPNDVDHRNRDKADNRWANLRHATPSQNGANRPAVKSATISLKAVTIGDNGKYIAHIRIMGDRFYLGSFDTPEEANAAYAGAARIVFGEFAAAA